jgi:hypothetical protein
VRPVLLANWTTNVPVIAAGIGVLGSLALAGSNVYRAWHERGLNRASARLKEAEAVQAGLSAEEQRQLLFQKLEEGYRHTIEEMGALLERNFHTILALRTELIEVRAELAENKARLEAVSADFEAYKAAHP